MNLFRITDTLERIERARRGPKGLLDEEWFDAHGNGVPPLPSYEGSASAPQHLSPTIIASTPPTGSIWPISTDSAPSSDPVDAWYQARMREAINDAYTRLRGNIAAQSDDRSPRSTGMFSGIPEQDSSGDDDAADTHLIPTTVGTSSGQEDALGDENGLKDLASGGTNIWTSADFDQCVAQYGSLGTLSSPKGRVELCSTGQTASTIDGSRYRFDVRDGVLLARDANGDVHSVAAGQGERATMTIDTDTGEIVADEPGMDI
jgi:hypothetical protein